MGASVGQEYVKSCKPLERAESAAAYVKLAYVQVNLEFLQEFVDMADRNNERVESYCLPGIYDLVSRQLEDIYWVMLLLCPELNELEAEEIQKGIELAHMRLDLRR